MNKHHSFYNITIGKVCLNRKSLLSYKWKGQFATTLHGFTAQKSYKTFPYLQPVDLSFIQ